MNDPCWESAECDCLIFIEAGILIDVVSYYIDLVYCDFFFVMLILSLLNYLS